MNRISSSLLFSFFLLTIHLWNVEGKTNCAQMSCGAGSCCNDFKLGGVCYNQIQYDCLKDNNANLVLCAKGAGACNGVCFDAKNYHCNGNALAQGAAPTQVKTSEAVKTSAKTSTSAVKTSTSQVKTSTSAVKTSTSAIKTSEAVKTSSVIVNPIPVPTNNRPYQTADLRIINSCKYTLWFEGRYGGKGAPIPGHSNTSTRALPGGYVDFTIPATGLPGTRFWAKYGCDGNGKNCKIGDQMQYYPEGGCPSNGCTAPIDSLFEATFGCKAGSSCANSNPTTWFDTSQVDGYTIPYKVTLNGEKNKCDCTSKGCGLDYIDASRLDLSKCPSGENLTGRNAVTSAKGKSLTSVDLRLIDKSTNTILGCLSPCKKMTWEWGLNEGTIPSLYYCCPTPNPANCQIGNGCISSAGCRAGPVEDTTYVKSIHDMAPGIYTYAYDDGVGLHACPAGTVTYTMEYCPAGSSAYPHPL